MSIVAGLREAAALVEAHPELPTPYVTSSSDGRAHVHWFLTMDGRTKVNQRGDAVRIMRAVGGKWDKETYNEFSFQRRLGLLNLLIQVEREAVCERVVTGTEVVTVPAVAAEPERTEERDVVEWRCEPVLKAAAAEFAESGADGSKGAGT